MLIWFLEQESSRHQPPTSAAHLPRHNSCPNHDCLPACPTMTWLCIGRTRATGYAPYASSYGKHSCTTTDISAASSAAPAAVRFAALSQPSLGEHKRGSPAVPEHFSGCARGCTLEFISCVLCSVRPSFATCLECKRTVCTIRMGLKGVCRDCDPWFGLEVDAFKKKWLNQKKGVESRMSIGCPLQQDDTECSVCRQPMNRSRLTCSSC